jgi:hypothetical protein
MDSSGCISPFSELELRRFLDLKTVEGFDNLRTENSIRAVLRLKHMEAECRLG